MIIDSHVHIGDWDYEWYSYNNGNDPILLYNWVDMAVFIPTDMKQNSELLQTLRLTMKRDTWFFIPWFDPKDVLSESTFRFIEKNIAGIHGLKVHSSIDKIPCGISNNIYKPLLNLARSFDLPLLVHCGRWQEMAGWKYLVEVAERHPDLKFIGAHLGGDREDLKIVAPRAVKERGLQNVWFDISATREWWTIGMAIEQIGIERIIFGSDYPVMHPLMSIASVKALGLTEDEEKRVFSENILAVLKDVLPNTIVAGNPV